MIAEKKEVFSHKNPRRIHNKIEKTTREEVLGKYLPHAMELINYAMLIGWKMKGNYI